MNPETMVREQWGFLPKLFAGGEAWAVEAMDLTGAVLFRDSALGRTLKELLLFAAAAASGDGYWAAIHRQALLLSGWPEEAVDAIPGGVAQAPLDDVDKRLAHFAMQAATRNRFDLAALANCEEAICLDAALVVGLSRHLIALRRLYDPPPDFRAPALSPCPADPDFRETPPAPFEPLLERALASRPDVQAPETFRQATSGEGASPDFSNPAGAETRLPVCEGDPDSDLVAAARAGDTTAFEQLVHKHGRRVYRTLAGILGDPEEARDVTQETFLKAFHRLPSFENRSRFSTWLVSIGANAAVERLRSRRPIDSLDENPGDDAAFRPRIAQAWTDSPEMRYAKAEITELVQREVRRLPAIYRTVVVLRDIEQLSTQEAAEALGVGIATVKSRLLRGRLLLREALSPYFAGPRKGALA